MPTHQEELQLQADDLFTALHNPHIESRSTDSLQAFQARLTNLFDNLKAKPELLTCTIGDKKTPFCIGVYCYSIIISKKYVTELTKELFIKFFMATLSDDNTNKYLKLEELDSASIATLTGMLFPRVLMVEDAENVLINKISALTTPNQSQKILQTFCYGIKYAFDPERTKDLSSERNFLLRSKAISFANHLRMLGMLDQHTAPLSTLLTEAYEKQKTETIQFPHPIMGIVTMRLEHPPGVSSYFNIGKQPILESLFNSVESMWQKELDANFPFSKNYLLDLRQKSDLALSRGSLTSKIPAFCIGKYFANEYDHLRDNLSDDSFKIMTDMIMDFGTELLHPDCLQIIIKDLLDHMQSSNFAEGETWQDYFNSAFEAFKLLRADNDHMLAEIYSHIQEHDADEKLIELHNALLEIQMSLAAELGNKYQSQKTFEAIEQIMNSSATPDQVYEVMDNERPPQPLTVMRNAAVLATTVNNLNSEPSATKVTATKRQTAKYCTIS